MSEKLTTLAQLRATAERAQGEAAQAAGLAAEAIEEINEVKADKPESARVTLTRAGWALTQNASQGATEVAAYPYYYEIPVAGLTEHDKADVSILPASMDTAVASGVWYMTETLEGKIRLRAKTQPASDLAAEYWITYGKEYDKLKETLSQIGKK